MASTEQFNSHFLDELFRLCLYKRDVCEVVCKHFNYEYIPVELRGYKQILKSMKTTFLSEGKLPSLGAILQMNIADNEVHQAVDRIREVALPDKESTLKLLEEYLKRIKFQILFQQTADLYNNGDPEGAINLQAEEAPKISNFSIFDDSSLVGDVFNDFWKRDGERFVDSNNTTNEKKPCAFGIDMLDALTSGGSLPGETDCFLGRSGSGKTKWLRWRGISAARRGFKVLHIQAEGTFEECMLGYDATWTGIFKSRLKKGEVDSDLSSKINKVVSDIKKKGGGIEVIAYEQFETATMRDVREKVIDYIKRHGCPPDLLLLDYLELFDPGNGKRYGATTEGEKFRREASARAFKNICNEFKIRGATAAQANDIAPSDFNNNDWVMTRHNVAGAKGLPDSFSYFFTWNVSSDEYKKFMGRLFLDKMREFQSGQTIRMCTDFNHDRFYNRPATIDTWPEDYVVK